MGLIVGATVALAAVAYGSIRDGIGGATAELDEGVRVSVDRVVDCRQPPLPADCDDPRSGGGFSLSASPPDYFLVVSVTNTSSAAQWVHASRFALEDAEGRSLGRASHNFYVPEAMVGGFRRELLPGESQLVNPTFSIGPDDQPATLVLFDEEGQLTGRLDLPNSSTAAKADPAVTTNPSAPSTVLTEDTAGGPTNQATPDLVVPELQASGYYIEPGSSATKQVVSNALTDSRSDGGLLYLVVLSEEPRGGATTFSNSILDLLGSGYVVTVARVTIGFAGDGSFWSADEMNAAINASLHGTSDDEIVQRFVSELAGP